MSFALPDSAGALRRERLRTARLYFVCDARPGGDDPEALLLAALNGGVDIVQLREKELERRAAERSGATFRRLCDTYSALFTVNDDPGLAAACGADGVHVGQDDLTVAAARAPSSGSPPTRPSRSRRRTMPPGPTVPTTSASARSGRRPPRRGGPPSASG